MSVQPSQHWVDVPERGRSSGLRIMYTAYTVLGRWAFTLLLYPVVAYFWLTARSARKASRDYLERVRRRLTALGRPAVRLNTFSHLLDFGNGMLDKGAAWAGRLQAADIDVDDPQLFKSVLESGRGAFFIGSHLGNLEVLRALAHIGRGIAINTLVFTRGSPLLNELMTAVGPRAFDGSIEIDTLGPESVARLQDKVRAGEHVAAAADRVSARHKERSIYVPFLGRPAPFPEGPFILASLLACPVYLLFCLRVGGRHRVFIEPFADPLVLPRVRRHAALEQAIARYAQKLEALCLLAPTQWFNFFDFWGQADSDRTADRSPETP